MELAGKELQEVLKSELGKHEQGVLNFLEPFDAKGVFNSWVQLIRSVDEMINIVFFELEDGREYDFLTSIRLDFSTFEDNKILMFVNEIITRRFNKGTAERFVKLLLSTVSISHALKISRLSNYGYGLSLDTVGDAAVYYQSRRGHLKTFLHLIPTYCKGSKTLKTIECLNYFLPQVEHSLVSITTINQQILLSEIFRDYKLSLASEGMRGNYQFNDLERVFLEPERVSIIDQYEHRHSMSNKNYSTRFDNKKVLSINELKYFINLIESEYLIYGIKKTLFSECKAVVFEILDIQKNDYHISVNTKDLRKILKKTNESSHSAIKSFLFFDKAGDFYHASKTRSPFIKVRGSYVSTVVLINSFMNNLKNVCLKDNKKFQINSGFIFEDMVRKILKSNGFFVTDITRINRKEFDLITIRDNEIYNFQCKNSFLDFSLVCQEKKLFVRCNRRLISYYKRALKKEEGRENLVKEKLGLEKINHFVVSRFPVFSDNNRIINFNSLEKWVSENFNG